MHGDDEDIRQPGEWARRYVGRAGAESLDGTLERSDGSFDGPVYIPSAPDPYRDIVVKDEMASQFADDPQWYATPHRRIDLPLETLRHLVRAKGADGMLEWIDEIASRPGHR